MEINVTNESVHRTNNILRHWPEALRYSGTGNKRWQRKKQFTGQKFNDWTRDHQHYEDQNSQMYHDAAVNYPDFDANYNEVGHQISNANVHYPDNYPDNFLSSGPNYPDTNLNYPDNGMDYPSTNINTRLSSNNVGDNMQNEGLINYNSSSDANFMEPGNTNFGWEPLQAWMFGSDEQCRAYHHPYSPPREPGKQVLNILQVCSF